MDAEAVHVQIQLTEMRGKRCLYPVPQFVNCYFFLGVRSKKTVVLKPDGAHTDTLDFKDGTTFLVADDTVSMPHDAVFFVEDGHF